MKTIFLHGALGQKFGRSFKLDIDNPAMGISALYHQLEGFGDYIREGSFVLIKGSEETGFNLDEHQLRLGFGDSKELHIIPHVVGAGGGKGGSAVKAILGVVLLAAGVALMFVPGAQGVGLFLIGTGLNMTVNGISGMLTHKTDNPGYGNTGPVDQRPSFIFNGATNSTQQGLPVPLIYGRMQVGSVVISAGIETEAVA